MCLEFQPKMKNWIFLNSTVQFHDLSYISMLFVRAVRKGIVFSVFFFSAFTTCVVYLLMSVLKADVCLTCSHAGFPLQGDTGDEVVM